MYIKEVRESSVGKAFSLAPDSIIEDFPYFCYGNEFSTCKALVFFCFIQMNKNKFKKSKDRPI